MPVTLAWVCVGAEVRPGFGPLGMGRVQGNAPGATLRGSLLPNKELHRPS